MIVKNPKFVPPLADDAPHVKHAAAVLALFDSMMDKAEISFDEIRAALPKQTAAELPDGVIHQIMLDAGQEVSGREPPRDPKAVAEDIASAAAAAEAEG